MDEIIITPELLSAILSLFGIVMTGLFAWMKDKNKLSEEQGDRILSFAKASWTSVKLAFVNKPEFKEKIELGDQIMNDMEKAWNDSKARTPEFDEYFQAMMKLIAQFI